MILTSSKETIVFCSYKTAQVNRKPSDQLQESRVARKPLTSTRLLCWAPATLMFLFLCVPTTLCKKGAEYMQRDSQQLDAGKMAAGDSTLDALAGLVASTLCNGKAVRLIMGAVSKINFLPRRDRMPQQKKHQASAFVFLC